MMYLSGVIPAAILNTCEPRRILRAVCSVNKQDYLALTGLFRAKWSALVHEEWMAALWHDRPDLTRQSWNGHAGSWTPMRAPTWSRISRDGIAAQHPDTFITYLINLNPDAVVGAAREHRASLKNPPKDVEEYLSTLERQGLT
jgi:hypothetical protein